ncbi:hypothetical protein [Sphingobacterium griseoflavum]|uniref:Uncharacterized protein n=1 Tax=Sphingobacterium griseoflavum TaxID=1474952 RepID=A0ABQ3I280_9SPHI|nr:hypothetical protein [Sphingobacterium griseoflavum]GHE43149.1 hypothetical protein GCM10017764_27950 [Sphingobacterium griseoflavum]
MGIRYEKDTILNWVNEMAKFLRLLVDKHEAFEEPVDLAPIENGYREFFRKERSWMITASEEELKSYVDDALHLEQIRPLALLLLRDALLVRDAAEKRQLLQHAKFLFGYVSAKSGSFSFEDYGNLATIDSLLASN